MSLIGVDIGTSGVRALALSTAGRPLAEASRPSTLLRPAPGLAEVDAEAVLRSVAQVLSTVISHPTVLRDPPEALSFSLLGEAVVPVDRDGRALANARIGMDHRGVEVADRIRRYLGANRYQQLTGQPLNRMFSVCKVADWLPGAATVRCLGDFVAARLGAEPAMDGTQAARTGAYDVEKRTWSAEIAEAAGVPTTQWSTVVSAASVIGRVSAPAAAATGLIAGTPIVVGSHDQASSYWGGGGKADQCAVLALGSSDCLTVGTSTRPGDLGGTGLATYPAGTGIWLTLAGTAVGGWALQWWAGIAGVGSDDAFTAFLANPSPRPPPLLVLPYLAGSGTLDNDEAARGAVLGLTLETSRAELTRAFLEASGYELARIIDALAERGIKDLEIRAVGTGSHHLASLQARACAAGRSLLGVLGNASARGAALQAGVGIGTYGSLDDLPEPDLHPLGPVAPSDLTWYDAQRHRYTQLAMAVAPLSHALSVPAHGRAGER